MVFRAGRLADPQRVLQDDQQLLLPGGHRARDHQQRDHPAGAHPRSRQLRGFGQGQGLRDRLPADLRLPARTVRRLRHPGELHLHQELGPAEHVPQRRQPAQQLHGAARQPAARAVVEAQRQLRGLLREGTDLAARSLQLALAVPAHGFRRDLPVLHHLQRADGTARRVDLLQRHRGAARRCAGREPAQRGHQDHAVLHRRPGRSRTAVVLHERPALLAGHSRQLLT